MEERRTRRTEDRLLAAKYYIEGVAERVRANAVALVDEDGAVICSTGAVDVTDGAPLHSASFIVGGREMTLSSLGGAPLPHHDLAAAVRRILF